MRVQKRTYHRNGRMLSKPGMRQLVLIGMAVLHGWVSLSAAPVQSVLHIGSGKDVSVSEKRARIVADFYGLPFQSVPLEEIQRYLQNEGVSRSAVVIDAGVLEDSSAVKLLIDTDLGGPEAVLIAEIQQWDELQEGLIPSLRAAPSRSQSNGMVRVTSDTSFARELAGIRIPWWGWEAQTEVSASNLQSLLWNEGTSSSVFGRLASTDGAAERVYVSSRVTASGSTRILNTYTHSNFVPLLPYVMFIKKEAGKAGAHAAGNFANLTIDDPMLLQPYGFIDYYELAEHMEQADFHTTIAFVPWNFDRFEMGVVALFRGFPSRYSLAVHGNDHYHREFGKGEDPGPLETEYKLVQAQRRMEHFEELSGVPWDPVMVFPHGIGPSHSLRLLKKTGFRATFNSRSVPVDEEVSGERPTADALRAVTVDYGNFASVKRFPAHYEPNAQDTARAAIDLFLGNPVLRYTHHAFFSKGAGAFDQMALLINGLGSEVEWTNLAKVSRNLYTISYRGNGQRLVRPFTDEFVLRNLEEQSVTYNIRKIENFDPPVAAVLLDKQQMAFGRIGDTLGFGVRLAPGEQRTIRIVREYPQHAKQAAVERHGFRKKAVRAAAEIRDRWLPRIPVLSALSGAWYGDDGRTGGKSRVKAALFGGFVGVALFGGLVVGWVWKKKRSRSS